MRIMIKKGLREDVNNKKSETLFLFTSDRISFCLQRLRQIINGL